jgi:hypothetical protein
MTRNPLINAISASIYISIVVSIMTYGEKIVPNAAGIIVPMAFLSLFVLSAALMGYIFFYKPMQMYFDGNKKEALSLFIKTVTFFALITIILFLGVIFVGARI